VPGVFAGTVSAIRDETGLYSGAFNPPLGAFFRISRGVRLAEFEERRPQINKGPGRKQMTHLQMSGQIKETKKDK
jgi:hypothetical protein